MLIYNQRLAAWMARPFKYRPRFVKFASLPGGNQQAAYLRAPKLGDGTRASKFAWRTT